MNTHQFQEVVDACASTLKHIRPKDPSYRSKLIKEQCYHGLLSAGEPTDETHIDSIYRKVCKELGRRSATSRQSKAKKEALEKTKLQREIDEEREKDKINEMWREANYGDVSPFDDWPEIVGRSQQ